MFNTRLDKLKHFPDKELSKEDEENIYRLQRRAILEKARREVTFSKARKPQEFKPETIVDNIIVLPDSTPKNYIYPHKVFEKSKEVLPNCGDDTYKIHIISLECFSRGYGGVYLLATPAIRKTGEKVALALAYGVLLSGNRIHINYLDFEPGVVTTLIDGIVKHSEIYNEKNKSKYKHLNPHTELVINLALERNNEN